MWGTVLKRDLLGEFREEDKFRSKEQLQEYLESEIEKQGENVVLRNLDVSLVEDLRELFCRYHNKLESLDLSGWDTSKVKNMNHMFYDCMHLKSLDLSGWNTSSANDMSGMFSLCTDLESLNLSGWDMSNIEDMSSMFYRCKNLKSLDVSGWDTSKVKYIDNVFCNCPAPYKIVDRKIIRR